MNVALRFFISLTFFVFGTAGVLHAQTTWTGSVSTDWNTAGNWDAGVPDATSAVIIPEVTNDPVISTATALAFSIEVQGGGLLTIDAAGRLTINTTATRAILNWGTVTNNGNITIGDLSGSGDYGIDNEAVFNNNAGAVISVDNTLMMAILNIGTMHNRGTVTMGANNSPGATGCENYGSITNYTSGRINIDRTSGAAFVNSAGDITNSGNITIGANYDCQSGLANLSIFKNEAGGQIAIDRTLSLGLLNYSGIFLNEGSIAFGGVASVGNFGIMNVSTFDNVTGAQINIDRVTDAGIATNFGDFNNAGIINIGANTNTAATAGITTNANFNNNAGGQININRVNWAISPGGTTFNNAGTVTVGALSNVPNLIDGYLGTFTNNTGGVLNGSGVIYQNGYVDAGGTLAPGAPIGTIDFEVDKDFTNGKLAIEITGVGTPGTSSDLVLVDGTATMGGSLVITTPGFTMSPGQSIVILQATTAVTGAFASVTWPAGVTGTVTYGATEVTLNVLSVLPLTLLEFSGNATGNKTSLQWKTADEVNTSVFEVERSANGSSYTTIGTVKAVGHNANSYSAIDEKPVAGNNYYRLKMKDLDGKFTLSQVVTVKHTVKDGLQLAPVPARSYVTVQLKDQLLLNQRAQVYNSIGYLVTEVVLTNGARIDLSGWPVGMYTIKTSSASYQFMKQ